MVKKCKSFSKVLENFDLFGKEIEIYYKGKGKRTSIIGFIFTSIYILAYLTFFIYKLVMMFKRTDVTFYDTYAFTGEPPNIKLTPEKFYGGFALVNPYTSETYVDNTIYTVQPFYVDGVKKDGKWSFVPTPLTLETCKLERFHEKYRDIFRTKHMEKMHCVPFLNHTLRGHLTYDVYSYYLVRFVPCINSTLNNNHCKSIEEIRKYLTKTALTFKMEDVDLTPQDYHNPVVLRGKEVSAYVSKNLFQDIHSFFQVVNIETDEDLIGFEAFGSIKKEQYIKYDQAVFVSQLSRSNLDQTVWNESIADVTIALSEKELTQKRTYPKLIVVLGDVGGLMEVLYSLFRILAAFLTDALYNASLVNHLFRFDLNKKAILVKSKNFKTEISKAQTLNLYNPKLDKSEIEIHNVNNKNNEFSKESNNKLMSRENLINIRNKKRTTKKTISFRHERTYKKESSKPLSIEERKGKNNLFKSQKNNKIEKGKEKENFELDKTFINETQGIYNEIIDKLVVDKCYSYFCFCRKKMPLHNMLLKEGMRIIIDNLDVQNLFKVVYKKEEIKEPIEMSYWCKSNLSEQKFNI